MGSIVYRILRGSALGLMFFLAATCNCFCDSYDQDPNDDIPPVTVEFHCVVPVGVRAVHCDASMFQPVAVTTARDFVGNATLMITLETLVSVAHSKDSPQLITPLRT